MPVIAAVSTGLELAQKIKPVAKALESIKALGAKLGIGGVDQDRFIERTSQVYKIFSDGGYSGDIGNPKGITYTSFNIGKSQVEDKKSKGNYYDEFQRLRKYVIARLNSGNPGLGDAYAAWVPNFPMAKTSDGSLSLGQMSGEPLTILKEFVSAYPPGTYNGDLPLPDKSVPQQYSNQPDLTKSKLPATETVGNTPDDINNLKAGFDFGDIDGKKIAMIVLIILLVWYFSKQ